MRMVVLVLRERARGSHDEHRRRHDETPGSAHGIPPPGGTRRLLSWEPYHCVPVVVRTIMAMGCQISWNARWTHSAVPRGQHARTGRYPMSTATAPTVSGPRWM